MRHYLFESVESGEQFIVGADTIEEAILVAVEEFGEAEYLCQLTDDEAEASGLDEY